MLKQQQQQQTNNTILRHREMRVLGDLPVVTLCPLNIYVFFPVVCMNMCMCMDTHKDNVSLDFRTLRR